MEYLVKYSDNKEDIIFIKDGQIVHSVESPANPDRFRPVSFFSKIDKYDIDSLLEKISRIYTLLVEDGFLTDNGKLHITEQEGTWITIKVIL